MQRHQLRRVHQPRPSDYTGEAAMNTRFGMFVLPVVETHSAMDVQSTLGAIFDDVEMAECMGLDTIWVAEHHGTRYGGACPSGMVLLAYLAGRTSQIRLGTAARI